MPQHETWPDRQSINSQLHREAFAAPPARSPVAEKCANGKQQGKWWHSPAGRRAARTENATLTVTHPFKSRPNLATERKFAPAGHNVERQHTTRNQSLPGAT